MINSMYPSQGTKRDPTANHLEALKIVWDLQRIANANLLLFLINKTQRY